MNAPLKKCSAYGADIITPHLPQAVFQRRVSTDTDTVFASARPESADKTITRGTDKSVPYKVRCKTQQRTNVWREATTVSSVTSTPGNKTLCRTNVARGTHGFAGSFEPGSRNMRIRSCVNAPLKEAGAACRRGRIQRLRR